MSKTARPQKVSPAPTRWLAVDSLRHDDHGAGPAWCVYSRFRLKYFRNRTINCQAESICANLSVRWRVLIFLMYRSISPFLLDRHILWLSHRKSLIMHEIFSRRNLYSSSVAKPEGTPGRVVPAERRGETIMKIFYYILAFAMLLCFSGAGIRANDRRKRTVLVGCSRCHDCSRSVRKHEMESRGRQRYYLRQLDLFRDHVL